MRAPRPRGRVRPGADRGFALLIVLWTLVLITLLVATMSAAGRSEVRITASLRAAAVAREAVDGAVQEAIFRVATGQWSQGPLVQRLRVGEILVEVRVENDAGKINLGNVPRQLLAALLQEVGVPPATARSLAAAIEDYESFSFEASPGGAKAAEYQAAGLPYGPSRQPFRSMNELLLVLGMTPDILARLAPYVSVTKGTGLDLAAADPVVRRAVATASAGGALPAVLFNTRGAAAVQIYGRAISGAAGAVRHAAIRLATDAKPTDPLFRLAAWD